MGTYRAPVADMRLAIAVAGMDEVCALPQYSEATPEAIADILDHAARFGEEVLAPLNSPGDRMAARCADGRVLAPAGFRDAYRQFVEAGWPSLSGAARTGGQGLPLGVAVAVNEIWASSNLAYSLGPLATEAAAQMFDTYGSEDLKTLYLPRIVSGKWTAAMCLTEPHAGTDLGTARTRAVRDGDRFRIHGTKIFITYGEHDLSENIVHFVLARLPDAPAGTAGLSLFLVPKFLVQPDESLGARNDTRCVSIERKLGIHASPTCVMSYGDSSAGAIGFLVGTLNRGLEAMFSMMNRMRLGVGVQAAAIAEAGFQRALDYARQRVQGRAFGASCGDPVPIARHPDVRRMLMRMRCETHAMRLFSYYVATRIDLAHGAPDKSARAAAQARADLLTPVIKGWAAEQAQELVSLALQVHGGAGYVEETGVAQILRDARVLSVYEATTGVQALDLVARKIARDDGAAVRSLLADIDSSIIQAVADSEGLGAVGVALRSACTLLERATDRTLEDLRNRPEAAAAGSVPYLMLAGTVCGAWQLLRAASTAARGRNEQFASVALNARFYADHLLPRAQAYCHEVLVGAKSTLQFNAAML